MAERGNVFSTLIVNYVQIFRTFDSSSLSKAQSDFETLAYKVDSVTSGVSAIAEFNVEKKKYLNNKMKVLGTIRITMYDDHAFSNIMDALHEFESLCVSLGFDEYSTTFTGSSSRYYDSGGGGGSSSDSGGSSDDSGEGGGDSGDSG